MLYLYPEDDMDHPISDGVGTPDKSRSSLATEDEVLRHLVSSHPPDSVLRMEALAELSRRSRDLPVAQMPASADRASGDSASARVTSLQLAEETGPDVATEEGDRDDASPVLECATGDEEAGEEADVDSVGVDVATGDPGDTGIESTATEPRTLLPDSIVRLDEQQEVFRVPVDITRDSRHRTRLPSDPESRSYEAMAKFFEREGQTQPLIGRWIDDHVEILGDDLSYDVLRQTAESIVVRLVCPQTEAAAFRDSNDDALRSPRRCAYENVLRVRGCGVLREAGWTQRAIGELLGVDHTTVSHREKQSRQITADALVHAGINPERIEHNRRLRQLHERQLKWIANGASFTEVTDRLTDLVLGTGTLWDASEAERLRDKETRERLKQPVPPAPNAEAFEINAIDGGRISSVANVALMTSDDIPRYLQALEQHLRAAVPAEPAIAA